MLAVARRENETLEKEGPLELPKFCKILQKTYKMWLHGDKTVTDSKSEENPYAGTPDIDDSDLESDDGHKAATRWRGISVNPPKRAVPTIFYDIIRSDYEDCLDYNSKESAASALSTASADTRAALVSALTATLAALDGERVSVELRFDAEECGLSEAEFTNELRKVETDVIGEYKKRKEYKNVKNVVMKEKDFVREEVTRRRKDMNLRRQELIEKLSLPKHEVLVTEKVQSMVEQEEDPVPKLAKCHTYAVLSRLRTFLTEM